MRFSFADAMIDPSLLAPLATAAEEAGFDGFIVPDSICYPEHSDSTYPYSADGTREFLEDKPFIEPFSLIPWLAATTTRIRFVPFVLKLPVRHPVLVAKQAASVAALAPGRLALGVGISPWPDDYEIMGVPWERRGKRMDEAMQIVRRLCAGGFASFDGEVYSIPSIKICPVPEQPIPLLVGGHSQAALRRAARLSDGWMHAGGGPEPLDDLLAALTAERRRAGTDDQPFEIHVISMDGYSTDGLERLEDAGVTDVIIGFRDSYQRGPDTQTLDEKVGMINWYAETVLAPFRERR